MRCGSCNADNSAGAKFCSGCGKPLSAAPTAASPTAGERADALGQLQNQLDAELQSSKAFLDAQLGKLSSSLRPPPTTPAAPPPSRPASSPKPAQAAPAGARGLVHPIEAATLLMPEPGQITQSASFVVSSPFVQNNPLYRGRLGNVSFEYIADDATVNAFATDGAVKTADGRTVEPPLVVYYGGLATAIRLAAAALSAEVEAWRSRQTSFGGSKLAAALKLLAQAVQAGGGKLELDASQAVFSQCILPGLSVAPERFVSAARSYSASMDMFTIAHEMGHLSLGHTLGVSLNYDVSRNQEREADSFASSVLSSSPFREHLFLGQVFVTVLFSWLDFVGHATHGTTHPLSRERFENALRSNEEAARDAATEFGLTEARLRALLPPT
jgi:hypothetical protein